MSKSGINHDNLGLFWRYIAERHSIYRRRMLGMKPPWTKDPVLQEYKFTNVFRDLDPGTIYVTDKILPRCRNLEQAVFNIIIYRLFNKISTFECHGIQSLKDFDKERFEQKIRNLGRRTPVFTNAFIVSGYPTIHGKDKISKVCNIIDSIHKEIPKIADTISADPDSEKTFRTITGINGIGKFLGYQICVDIGYYDKKIYDESSHVVCGPGCVSGLKRIFNGKFDEQEAIMELYRLQDEGFKMIGEDMNKLFSGRHEKRLNLMALENCLCEFSKYMKARTGEGRPRNRYNLVAGINDAYIAKRTLR